MEAQRVLIIDDELHISEALKLNLMKSGFEVEQAFDGKAGLEKIEKQNFDLIVVDLMMPEIDGVGVIKVTRLKNEKIPIMVISAKDQIHEKIKCLNLGVDDYLAKPFHLEEFLLRVKRLIQRSNWNEKEVSDLFKFGENVIDFKNLKGHHFDKIYELTLQEVKILRYFVDHANTSLTRDEILKNALGYSSESETRTLDNFVVRFRKYFEDDPKNPKYFKSIRSVGYFFDIKD